MSTFGANSNLDPGDIGIVQLVHTPQWCVEQPPLGLAYITGFVEQHGYKVRQVDYSVQLFAELPPEQKHFLESSFHLNWLHDREFLANVLPVVEPWIDRWANELAKTPGRVIGFTMLSTSRLCTLEVVKRVKKINPDKFIVIGGPHVTRYEGGPAIAQEPNVDVVVPGEGEETFLELLRALERGQALETVPGLLLWRNGQVHDTGDRPLIKTISELPFPKFSGFDLKDYRSLTLPILGSRGCIYKCAFCSETVLWRRYRYRTGENMFLEFKKHVEELDVRSFYIVDSLINGNMRELEDLCDRIIAADLKIWWSGKASIRRQMTPAILQKMKRAGCCGLDYGLESGSPKVVKDMKKGFDMPTAVRVIRESHEAGIHVGLFLLAGFPTEQEDDFQDTLKFITENAPHIHHVTPGWGMGIQAGSDVQLNQDKYGIFWKDGEWYSEHTTPQVRADRTQRLQEYCKTLFPTP